MPIPAPSPLAVARELRLLAAVAVYLDAVDAGQAPDAAAFAEGYPADLAGELLEFAATHARVERLTAPLRELARATRNGEGAEGGG
jgi:hypothetical protein